MEKNEIININGCTKTTLKQLEEWNNYKGKDIDLPSSHPYWTIQVLLDDKKSYDFHYNQYLECKDNIDKIKFLYNSSTNLDDIQNRINKYLYSIQILKQLNIL